MEHLSPEAELSVEELCNRYEISKQSLYDRLRVIGIKGYKKKGMGVAVFFSPEMIFQLDVVDRRILAGTTLRQIKKATDEFRNGGGALDEGEQATEQKVVDVGSTYSLMEETDKKIAETTDALVSFEARERQAAALAAAFTTAVGNALKETATVTAEPLMVHRRLSEVAREEYFLTTKQLAEILGITSGTLKKWGTNTIRNGFVLKRVGDAYWVVVKATLEQQTTPTTTPTTPDYD
jgi:DNA-binding transcriptional regulator YiaG